MRPRALLLRLAPTSAQAPYSMRASGSGNKESRMTTAEPKIAKAASREARASFRWDDPLRFDDQLTEDERLIRNTARAYAQANFLPPAIEAYLHEQTDPPI